MKDSAPTAATPRPAATAIVLREHRGTIEVLIVRRHERLAFMGGLWVFPGGQLATADSSNAALACIRPHSGAHDMPLRDLHGQALDARLKLGLIVAAHRETFEETGLLLATDRDGCCCRDDPLNRARAQRRAVLAEPAHFAQLLHDCGVAIDLEQLLYWAHWITPSQAPRRFDTRFFVLHAPADQPVVIDPEEASDYAWMTPAALIEAASNHELPVSPPTLYNVMELAHALATHRSVHALFTAERQRMVAPVMPKLIDDGRTLVLPWDPDYPDLPGDSAPKATEYSSALRALASRAQFPRR